MDHARRYQRSTCASAAATTSPVNVHAGSHAPDADPPRKKGPSLPDTEVSYHGAEGSAIGSGPAPRFPRTLRVVVPFLAAATASDDSEPLWGAGSSANHATAPAPARDRRRGGISRRNDDVRPFSRSGYISSPPWGRGTLAQQPGGSRDFSPSGNGIAWRPAGPGLAARTPRRCLRRARSGCRPDVAP